MKNIIECIETSSNLNSLSVQSGNDVVHLYKKLVYTNDHKDTDLLTAMADYCKFDTQALLDLSFNFKKPSKIAAFNFNPFKTFIS